MVHRRYGGIIFDLPGWGSGFGVGIARAYPPRCAGQPEPKTDPLGGGALGRRPRAQSTTQSRSKEASARTRAWVAVAGFWPGGCRWPEQKKSLGGSTVEEYEVDYLLHRQEWGRKEIERQAASSRFAGLGLRRHQRGP